MGRFSSELSRPIEANKQNNLNMLTNCINRTAHCSNISRRCLYHAETTLNNLINILQYVLASTDVFVSSSHWIRCYNDTAGNESMEWGIIVSQRETLKRWTTARICRTHVDCTRGNFAFKAVSVCSINHTKPLRAVVTQNGIDPNLWSTRWSRLRLRTGRDAVSSATIQ